MSLRPGGVLLAALCACTKASTAVPSAAPSGTVVAPTPVVTATPGAAQGGPSLGAGPVQLTARSIPLPGASGPVTVDYLASRGLHARVYVPVGDTGSLDVFDVATSTFRRIDGFKTAEREVRGKRRMMGPSAATVGDGFVYVGNRATSEVCAVEEETLKLGSCLKLSTPTDGVAYVASEKEVWVTTPRDHSLTVLDASKPDTLKPKLAIKTDGDTEGYAVDVARGLFYTNLEDSNRTLAVDIKTHSVKATWASGCGPDGPRGVAVDGARDFVIVACTQSVNVFDGSHDGAPLGTLDTGAGVDNIEYLDAAKLLVVAAGKAARLTVARLNDHGAPTVVGLGGTAEGARNAVADGNGNIYLVDARAARLLTFAGLP
jgi:DNA-binding beta-propeller fold protein YncE